MDIGTEELSHLEVIGTLAMMHLKPIKGGRRAEAEADPLLAITGCGGVGLVDSQGNAWTSTLPEGHRRAGQRPAQQHRRRGPRQGDPRPPGAKDVAANAPWTKGFEVVDNPGFDPRNMKLDAVPSSVKQPAKHAAE